MRKTITITLEGEIAGHFEKLQAIMDATPSQLINELLADPLRQIVEEGDTNLLQRYLQAFRYTDKEEALAIIKRYETFVRETQEARGDNRVYHGDAKPARTSDGYWEVLFKSTNPDDDDARYR